MTTRVTFKSKSGSTVEGELAEPSGSDKSPAVVLLQEWWGVNDHVLDLVTRMSNEGFLVLAPDLYHGKKTKDPAEASKLMTELDTLEAVKEIAGAVAYLKEHARSNGKVGVIGFCMGGALSFASACHVDGIGAVVPWYGMPPAEKVDYKKATAPIQTHVGKKDAWVSPEKAEAVKKEIEGYGKTTVELHVYDADHAFANNTRPEVYNEAAAKQAWDRSVTFLKKHLS